MVNYKSALKWNDVIITHEGTSQVKRSKIDLLHSQYKNFYMNESESIDEMLTQFTKITNGLSSLGDVIDYDQNIRKVIRPLPKSWEVETTTLEELSDREEIDFSGFIENLKAHEMEMKVQEEREAQKEKIITFITSPPIPKDDDFIDEFSMLMRKVRKMFYKKGRMSNFQILRIQEKSDWRKEDIGLCYNC